MADPKDDAVFKAIDALKLDDNQKADLFDAYHAGSENEAISILSKYKGKIDNAILDTAFNAHRYKDPSRISPIKPTAQPPATQPGQAPVTAQPSATPKATPPVAKPGIMERATKNASGSLVGAVESLSPIHTAANQVARVASDTAEGYEKGGIGGAILGGVTSPVKQVAEGVGHMVKTFTSPGESFAQDPFGTILTVVSTAIPEFAAAKAGGGITGGIRAGMRTAGTGDVLGAFKSAWEGMTPPTSSRPTGVTPADVVNKPVAPGTQQTGPIAETVNKSKAPSKVEGSKPIIKQSSGVNTMPMDEPPISAKASAEVFNSDQVPMSRRRFDKQSDTRPTPQASGGKETGLVKVQRQQKQLPAPEVKAEKSTRFYGDDKGQVLDTANIPVIPETALSTVPKPTETPKPPSGEARFYTDSKAKTVDVKNPPSTPTPIPNELGTTPEPKQLESGTVPKQLEAPKSDLDTAAISQEVNAPTTVVDNMGKLSNEQLQDIITQYEQPGVVDFHAADFDPIKFENIRQVRNAAKAVMKKRAEAVYPEGDMKRPLDYTPDTPATPAAVAERVPTKSAVVEPRIQGPQENPVYPKEINSAGKTTTVPATPTKAPEVQAPSKPIQAEVPPAKTSVPVAKAEPPKPVTPPVTPKPAVSAPVETPVTSEIPMPKKSAPKPEPVKESPKAETSVSDIQVIPRDKSGKANYREGGSNASYSLEPDETLVTRKNPKDPEILDKYVVKVNDKGISIMDEESKVVGKYGKGMSLEDVIRAHFGTPAIPESPTAVTNTSAKISPKKDKTSMNTQTDTSPQAAPSVGKALKDKLRAKEILKDIKKNGTSTKEQLDELHGLVGEKEADTLISSIKDPDVNTFRLQLDVKTPGQKIINQEAKIRKINPNKTEIDVSGSHNRTGDNMKETFSVEKDGDRFVVIDKSRKRIASYTGIKTIDEAVKLATEKLKTI